MSVPVATTLPSAEVPAEPPTQPATPTSEPTPQPTPPAPPPQTDSIEQKSPDNDAGLFCFAARVEILASLDPR